MDEIKATLGTVPTVEASIANATVNYDPGSAIRHSDITERSFPDQHPISAITGLEDALENAISQEVLDLAVEDAVKAILESGELKGEKGEQGPQGEKGADGSGIQILGSYSTVNELRADHPNGNIGDAYMISGSLYIWSANDHTWINAGSIKGEDGRTPVKGSDYFTDADKEELLLMLLSALPTWTGGSY